MSRRRNQVHAYDQVTSTMLRGVVLPQKLKCCRCEKHKNPPNFSETQLNHARMAMRNRIQYSVKCNQCNGSRIMEIKCTSCLDTKGLEEFAKSQRNKPDSAICFECTEIQLATEAVEPERYDNHRDAFQPSENDERWPEYWRDNVTDTNPSNAGDDDDDDDDARSDQRGGVSINNYMMNMAINNPPTATLIDTEDSYSLDCKTSGKIVNRGDPVMLTGEQWQVAQSKSWKIGSSANPASSDFNTNGYGTPVNPHRTASVSGSAQTFPSNFTERSKTTAATGGWAKIKAYKPEKQPESKPEPEEDWKSESDSDDGQAESDSDSDADI
ncbi:hypothetical protein K504DRAFT_491945 [Pleomassaria siparia CBS 279.74]|uniref:Stc1 domain-containing protein n=1 Tax=Pleomassaria siparia CBS 279.74 TaxID=1314801 RepID=A0A6G1K5V6_9PLEO|nr:hypothetical protein K504DRAFT_491945 [Pleomassaria siparia CBS 279.74]